MKVRRQGGATLGLVAACVLLVIVIGVGFYFLSKIIGGGREVANATDAGALNVAKQALKRGTVTLTAAQAAEFGGLVDPPPVAPATGNITLITYNRIIAQAMMVAQNAQLEGTATAKTNAQATAALAQSVGQALKNSLNGAATTAAGLPTDFNSIAGISNTKMWNGNTVSCTTIKQGYLKASGSSNVIFDASTIAAFQGGWSPKDTTAAASQSYNNAPNSTDSLGAPIGGGAHYMPGYDYNQFLGGSVQLTGVPVFPNTKPHLVDIGTFNTDLAANSAGATDFAHDPNTSPNCFDTSAQATEAKSGNIGGTLACAVVGVLNKDYKASIPRGFVRISNGPDAVAANGSFGVPISDGTNDIFNNQLFNGSGITQDGSSVFTTNPGYLNDWSAFNHRSGPYDNSGTPAAIPFMTAAGAVGPAWVALPAGTIYHVGDPVPIGDLPTSPVNLQDMAAHPDNYDAGEGGLRAGTDCNHPYATLAQLESIGMSGGSFNCTYSMYDNNVGATHPNCASVTNVDNWQSNYSCTGLQTGPFLATSGANQGVTNVEYMKAELLTKIAGRLGGSYCADVSIPSGQPSGVKFFSRGVPGNPGSAVAFDPLTAPTGSPVVNFETVGTPFDYLNQISNNLGACATGSSSAVLDQITSRMQQVESSVTQAQVVAALKSAQLHLKGGSFSSDNGTLYLYVDPTTRAPKMTALLPSTWGNDTTVGNANFPDGPAPAVGSGECTENYPLNGWVVNTQFTLTGTGKGDAHYHDQPFTQPGDASGPPSYNSPDMGGSGDNGSVAPISGQDAAIFKASSGSQLMLGELKFQENTQGTTFCKPN